MLNVAKDCINEILTFVKKHNNFLVSTHARGDGDAIGSALAVNMMLRKMRKNSVIVIDKGVGDELSFLPGADTVSDDLSLLRNCYEGLFVVDSASFDRLEEAQKSLSPSIFIINIDHHISNTRFGDINWIDPNSGSTGEMIYKLIKTSGVKIDEDIASNLYVAIITDTGRFCFSNTKPESLICGAELISYGASPSELAKNIWRNKRIGQLRLLAECINRIRFEKGGKIAWVTLTRKIMRKSGYVPIDTQEYVEAVKSIKGVEIAILFRETEQPCKIKVSFRTENGINGEKIASLFGGGGHPRAAGATIEGNIKEVEKCVILEVIKSLKASNRKSAVSKHTTNICDVSQYEGS
jgi:phosphoesterase RecJ-like protein